MIHAEREFLLGVSVGLRNVHVGKVFHSAVDKFLMLKFFRTVERAIQKKFAKETCS